MNISEFCIRRPVFTILLMAAIFVGGIAGYRNLTVSALPKIDFPTIQVTANLPGASPETMASSVATPLERQFSTIPGVSSITSSSFLGSSQITIQFDLNRNIDGAALDVQSAISATLRSLPKEMTTPPSFRKVNPAEQPVFFIVVSSDSLPLSKVNDYVDTLISQRISTLSGVAQVVIYGEQKFAVKMQVDPAKIASLGIGLNEIGAALSEVSSNTPAGDISGKNQLFNIKVTGQPFNAEGYNKLIAIWKDGSPIKFSDIGTVKNSIENERSIGFIGDKQSLVIAIQRQQDANVIEVVQSVRNLLPVFENQLPASIKLIPLFDRSVAIKESVRDVQITLFITIALVISIIYLFLGNFYATLIPALAVPLSILATYGGMLFFGFSINILSLLAITLSVGFVIDDAIVMLENIIRHIEEGMSPLDAALKGSKEITFTIISITLSLVAVFIPVLFMGGIVGRLINEFAITISFAILVSAFISLTLTPMLASRLLKFYKVKHVKKENSELESNGLFQKILNAYSSSLKIVLDHKFITLIATVILLIITIFAFINAPKGFFPIEDTGFIFTYTEASQDISFDAMLSKQKQIAQIITEDPAVDKVYHSLGGGRGALNSGRIFVGLKPHSQRDSIPLITKRLSSKFANVVGIKAYMQPIQNLQINSRLSKSLYQYTLQAENLELLNKWALLMQEKLSVEKGFINVTSDLQLKSLQVVVDLKEDIATRYGIGYNDVRNALYYAFGSAQVGTIYTASNDYAVILELFPEFRQNPDDIKSIYIKGNDGTMVKLDTIANISLMNSPLTVNHQGQLPSVTLSFDLEEGRSLGTAIQKIEQIQNDIFLPQSIITSFQGSAQVFQDSLKGQGLLLLFAVIVIYIILGMLYESFIHPITILSGLPSAALGAIITLLIFGMDINIVALIGIILLIGIVKKNSIMMVDFAITERARGALPNDAIFKACMIRFRPIMMTTMAALFGSLPIAFALGAGSEFRQPLGIAVVGGLLTSQLLTLYITPVIYLYLERFNHKNSII